MKSPQAPAPPDPAKTAAAQTQSNRETAITQNQLNSQNQITPHGSLTYRQIGTWEDGTPRFEATTALSPGQQKLFDQQEQIGQTTNQIALDQSRRIGDHLSKPLDTSNLPQRGELSTNDYSEDRRRVEEALLSRLNPQLERDRQAADTRLVQAGIRPGSDAWHKSMQDKDQAANDARLQAIIAGGQEQSRLFGMDLSGAQFRNQSRDQALRELLTERNQPINEITALLSSGQVSQPNFVSTPQTGIEGTDIAGLTQQNFNNQMGVYNQQMARNNAMMGGLFGLGGAALGGWGMGGFKAPTGWS